jgi:hypothetical protein
MSDDFSDRILAIVKSVDQVARIRERMAFVQILEDELKHVTSQLELDLLDRIKGAVDHRHKNGVDTWDSLTD